MNPRRQLPESGPAYQGTGNGATTGFTEDPLELEPQDATGGQPVRVTAREWHGTVREAARVHPPESASGSRRAHKYLDEPSFAECLNRQMRDAGISLRELARRSWLDIGYVSRLVNMEADLLNPRYGEQRPKHQPSRDAVIRLGLAMNLPIEEMDELLLTAGFAPLVRN